jgi:hypothetical protein
VLLSVTVLPACSTQATRAPETQEQQQTANRPTRGVSKTNTALDKAGGATLAVVVVGVLVGIVAVPILLITLL